MKNKLSIVFLHWVEINGPITETLVSLESIFRYTTVPYELIIVSNGSIDALNRQIQINIGKYQTNKEYHYPIDVKFVNLETNVGVSKGFNKGLKEVSDDTKYISCFCNDWFVSPEWSERLIEEAEKNPENGMLTACTNHGTGSMSDDPNNPVRFPRYTLDITAPDFWNKLEQISNHCKKARGHISYNKFICLGFFFTKEVFDKVGLFDERIFCANDVSFTKRAELFGYKSITVWSSYIYHIWHSSFSQINDKETFAYLKPKDKADWELILTDEYYKNKDIKNIYQDMK